MAVTSTYSNGTGGSPSVNISGITASNKILLLLLASDAQAGFTVSASPSGFTVIDEILDTGGRDTLLGAWYKVADGTETTVGPTLTGGNGYSLCCYAFDGDTTTPFDVTYVRATHQAKSENDATPAVAAITTATNNATVFVFGGGSSSTANVPTDITHTGTGYTEAMDQHASGYGFGWSGYKVVTTAGTEAASTLTYASGINDEESQTIILAFKPAAAGSGSILSQIIQHTG